MAHKGKSSHKRRAPSLPARAPAPPVAAAPPAFWLLRPRAVAALLLVAVFATYANSFTAGWVSDSHYLITDDARTKATAWEDHPGQPGIRSLFTQDYWGAWGTSGVYRPVTTISYWLNRIALGAAGQTKQASSWSFHLVNLLIHWVNALLVFFLIARLLGRRWTALFGALLFATHPIATEPVTNLFGRADLLAACTVLGGLLIYIAACEARGRRRRLLLLGLGLTTAIGLFAKESAICVGIIIPLYDLCFRWRLERPDRWRQIRESLTRWLVMVPPLAFMIIARSLVFASSMPAQRPFLDNPLFEAGLLQGRMTAVAVIGKYLYRLVWPGPLSFDYSFNEIPLFGWHPASWATWQAMLSLALVAAAVYVAVRAYRRHRAVTFFIGLFAAALLPTANIFFVIGCIMAERFLYLPLAGFAALAVLAVGAILRRIAPLDEPGGAAAPLARVRGLRFAPHLVLAAVAIAYGVRGHYRNRDWQNEITTWKAALEVTPRSFRNYQALAAAYFDENAAANIDKAIALAERGAAIIDVLDARQNQSSLYRLLGHYYYRKGDMLAHGQVTTPESEVWFRKSAAMLEHAVVCDRSFNEINRGREVARGRAPDEVADVGFGPLYAALAGSYARLGLRDQALAALAYRRHLQPGDVDALEGLASFHRDTGRPAEAAAFFLQLFIFANRQGVVPKLNAVCRSLDDGNECVRSGGARPNLEMSRPLVRQLVASAFTDWIRAFSLARQPQVARDARRFAVDEYQLAPAPLDAVLESKAVPPVPPAPVFYRR